jgi:CheY-like chemotaxis protein
MGRIHSFCTDNLHETWNAGAHNFSPTDYHIADNHLLPWVLLGIFASQTLFPATSWTEGFWTLPAPCGDIGQPPRDHQYATHESSSEDGFQPLNTPEAAAVGGTNRNPSNSNGFCAMPGHHHPHRPAPLLRPSPRLLEPSRLFGIHFNLFSLPRRATFSLSSGECPMPADWWLMKLLIVEDDSSLAEITAELLKSLDQTAKMLEAITLAADLQTAIRCLPGHDAVLCDGVFPISTGSSFLVDDWDVVRYEANRRGIHFVLYSGSADALECARASNTPALTKPATVEEIYAALTCPRLTSPSTGTDCALKEARQNPMSNARAGALEEYCLKLETEADAIGRQAEGDARSGHLHAFNCGRSLGRMELSGDQLGLRVRWLLFGAAAGLVIAGILLQVFRSMGVVRLAR